MRHGLITTGLNHTLHKFTTPIFDNGYEKDGKGGYKQISTEGGNDTDHLYENGVKIESREVSSSPHELTKRSYGIKAGSPNLIEVDIIGTAIGGRAAITGLWKLGSAGINLLRAGKSIQLTKSVFGHTFTTHGEEMTEFLVKRAIGSGSNQGQFLNNQKAAKFIMKNLSKLSNGAQNVPIPKNLPARVIMPDGSFKSATHIRLVPGGKGVKTAYPLIL
ncbi:hypothetical protein [Empedobacter brevis]|uniref:hypothetical protein n=1 Tax=Empedobacter brevis TaxID=247 RepID=UPI0033408D2E